MTTNAANSTINNKKTHSKRVTIPTGAPLKVVSSKHRKAYGRKYKQVGREESEVRRHRQDKARGRAGRGPSRSGGGGDGRGRAKQSCTELWPWEKKAIVSH